MKIDSWIHEKSSYLLSNLTNFSEVFRKDVTYGNIKSREKSGFHPLFRRYTFGKATNGGGSQINPTNLFRVKRLYLTVLKLRSFKKDSNNFHHLI